MENLKGYEPPSYGHFNGENIGECYDSWFDFGGFTKTRS
jgi:hypothetical protein